MLFWYKIHHHKYLQGHFHILGRRCLSVKMWSMVGNTKVENDRLRVPTKGDGGNQTCINANILVNEFKYFQGHFHILGEGADQLK